MPSGSRILGGAAYVAVFTALVLLLLEGAVRVLGLAPRLPTQYAHYVEDPVLTHRPRPSSVLEGRSSTDEFDFRYEHNARGFRGREVAVPKPEGTFRILGLGDSFTYGAGAGGDEIYLSRLEARLNQRPGDHPPVEVVNAGIPRFFPETERLLLETEGPELDPDLVLVGFVPNDVVDTHLGTEGIQVLPDGRIVSNHGARMLAQLGPLALTLYQNVHFLRIPVRAYLARQMQDENPVRPDEIERADGFHEDDWREVEAQYARMIAIAEELGARLVLIHLPRIGPWDEGSSYPAARLRAFADAHGAGFVDALPAIRAHADPASLYWPEDLHPTPAAHAIFADAIYEALLQGSLVP